MRSEAIEAIVVLLSPITPHVTEHLWSNLGHSQSLVDVSWPEVREDALARNTLTLVVQVNGKLRGRIEVAAGTDNDLILTMARDEPSVTKFLEGMVEKKRSLCPETREFSGSASMIKRRAFLTLSAAGFLTGCGLGCGVLEYRSESFRITKDSNNGSLRTDDPKRHAPTKRPGHRCGDVRLSSYAETHPSNLESRAWACIRW